MLTSRFRQHRHATWPLVVSSLTFVIPSCTDLVPGGKDSDSSSSGPYDSASSEDDGDCEGRSRSNNFGDARVWVDLGGVNVRGDYDGCPGTSVLSVLCGKLGTDDAWLYFNHDSLMMEDGDPQYSFSHKPAILEDIGDSARRLCIDMRDEYGDAFRRLFTYVGPSESASDDWSGGEWTSDEHELDYGDRCDCDPP